MLPFSKRKNSDELVLDDADIVVLEEAAVEIDVADLEPARVSELDAADLVDDEDRPQLPHVSAPPKASLRRLVTPHARRDRFEDDVADECLKSIAAATAQTNGPRTSRLSDSFPASIVPAAPRLPHFDTSVDDLLADAPLPQFELSDADETTRRPALSSSSSMPIARDSVPGVLPVPSSPLSVSSLPTPVFSRTTSSPNLSPAASSIAPVAMNSTPGSVEPTLILVRQPPKAAWVAAAAFLGAACALMGMRILTRQADAPQTIVLTAPPPPATQAAAAAPPAPPATVRFNDDQGVAVIAAPTTTVSAAPPPAPKPVVTTASVKTTQTPSKTASLGPKLPDGSMALTKASPPTPPPVQSHAAAPPTPEPTPAAAAQPASRKKLTPEQELAEAQLKASMK